MLSPDVGSGQTVTAVPLKGVHTKTAPPPNSSASTVITIHEDKDPDDNTGIVRRRKNLSAEAVGKMKRKTICGFRMLLSPDHNTYWAPTIFTSCVVLINLVSLWDKLSALEYAVIAVLLTSTFVCSFLVTATDPGVYPRLAPDEDDPMLHNDRRVLCRVCGVRRPKRASHCYTCGVCVLEHDHHCGIIGGCVGARTLRWFTSYLVSAAVLLCLALFWQLRLVVRMLMAAPPAGSLNGAGQWQAAATTTSTTTTTTTTTGQPYPGSERRIPLWTRRPTKAPHNVREEFPLTMVGGVMFAALDFMVLCLVGGMAVLYVGLTLTSVTRRESQSSRGCWLYFSPVAFYRNVVRAFNPPPSLVMESDEDTRSPDLSEV